MEHDKAVDTVMKKFQNMAVLEVAQILEDGLVHGGWLHPDLTMGQFISSYIKDVQNEELINWNI